MATAPPITEKGTAIPGGGETAIPSTGETAIPGGGETAPGEAAEPTEEDLNEIKLGKVSPFDPTFILILAFAIFCDLILDPLIETIGLPTVVLPILNRVIDIVTLVIIGGWMYSKSKQIVIPEKLAQRLKGMEKKILAKIQVKIQKKVTSKALKRVLARVGGAFVIEMIPGVAIFTSWVAAVLSML